ncbi:MAG: ThiF family adenylyltransferase [Actinobacteria bacterium]|nr:ThiF family adenylyltransferase [Actinomycetota bacterium]
MLDLIESRYDRQERISWWDQSKLRAARVLVVGAGALGNEIVKNLALVGVGQIDIVDMDSIEGSNLARCALFRDSDRGRPKAEALAHAAAEMNPEVRLAAYVCSVQQLGAAWLLQYDVVIAGLDSREARLWLNASCRRMGMHWIDGAIEGLQGIVRVFGPEGACYDCTLGEKDRAVISHRRSCALLSPEELASGKTPTNATTASVVAGLEVQEAIKMIVGRLDLLALTGKVWRLDGETMMTSVVEYTEDQDCMSHELVETWISTPAEYASLQDVITQVELARNCPVDAVYFPDDVITVEPCAKCGGGEQVIGLRPLLSLGAGRCGSCASALRMESRTSIDTTDDLSSVAWDRWLWPRREAISLRVGDEYVHVILEGRS